MRIALAQLNFHIGNFEFNVTKIKASIKKAKSEQAELIVFPELAVCGYPPRDFLEFNDFIKKCEDAILEIAQETQEIAVIVGEPSINPRPEGKNLFNTAFFLHEGKIQSMHNKALLPTYDVFDEYRYFEPARDFKTVEYLNEKLAITVCEDIWDVEDDLMYTVSPMDELSKQGATIAINISASPFSFNHFDRRIAMLKKNSKKYKIPFVYVNHIGAQTELIFDGASLVVSGQGEVVHQQPFFKESISIIDTSSLVPKTAIQFSEIELIHDALILGIRNYFEKLGFKTAILGLSGGIDSAVTLALAAEALGKENVHAVLMPSEFSSNHSIDDAKKLAANLNIKNKLIPIKEAFHVFEKTLEEEFKDTPFGLAEENIQARIRGVLLMAFSNKFGHILLNTSNKSEAAVGYGTLYGDMNGGLSVLGDVYKTQVYELAHYINREKEIIPKNTITKPPSAELRPDQKDSDSLPEYDILDKILFHYIEGRYGPDEIKAMGFDEQLVDRILKLVNINEYKRHQTPPILRISDKAFGMGRRMPIVAKYLS